MMTAVENCKKSNIHGNCTWIMAFPGEKLEHLKTSVAFIKWQQDFLAKSHPSGSEERENAIKSVNARMFTATAYPGTEMWRMVKPELTKHFDITYDSLGHPVCDDAFHNYVLELDDATKVLNNKNGEPVNFGAMPMDLFLQAREYADAGQIEKILDM
jgi:hypothetical protein